MLIVKETGNCPRCGKPYSDFEMLTLQGLSFHCERCDTEYDLCPDCRKEVDRCPKCGGRLLDSWEYAEKLFGGRIIF